jgi:diguanylate cyclase (GGDEF)-like protein
MFMKDSQEPKQIMDGNYYGHILNGEYSIHLRSYVKDLIDRFRAYDETGSPAIPYISAWEDKGNVIWYEFISKRLIEILGCTYSDAPESFRKSIIKRHVYKHSDVGNIIRQEVIRKEELQDHRTGLRDEVKERGFVEAVYKVVAGKGKIIWVKDQASVEAFGEDGIYISLGKEALRKSEEKFRELAVHDGLTGLYNTRYLYQALSELISENSVSKRPFSLIFMDIDDFKQVVDTYGHLKASQALQEFASTINGVLQKPAYAVAYGGDEFVIVLPGLNKRQALHMAENLNSGLRVRLRASFGVSTFPDDATNLSGLLSLADQAMFSVKETGKDNISGTSMFT